MANPILKFVVVGDSAVGKTSLLSCFESKRVPVDHVPTIFDYVTKSMTVGDTHTSLHLWDTDGSGEYTRLRRLSYPETNAFLLVFSLESPMSLTAIEEHFYPEVMNSFRAPVVLVGTHADACGGGGGGGGGGESGEPSPAVPNKKPLVRTEEALRVACDLGAPYVETCAMNAYNVDAVFEVAAQVALRRNVASWNTSSPSLMLGKRERIMTMLLAHKHGHGPLVLLPRELMHIIMEMADLKTYGFMNGYVEMQPGVWVSKSGTHVPKKMKQKCRCILC